MSAERAMACYRAGRLDEAARLYRQALVLAPDSPDLLHLLGVIAYRTGAHSRSVSWISRAISVNAEFSDYHTNLGLVLNDMGRRVEAIACHRRALALRQDQHDAHLNLGFAYQCTGATEAAGDHYRRALCVNPASTKGYSNLADLCGQSGDSAAALQAYGRASRLNRSDPALFCDLGRIHQKHGDLDRAMGCYRDALEADAHYVRARLNLGTILHVHGDLARAGQTYRHSLILDPGDPDSLNNYGVVLQETGNWGQAEAVLGRALRTRAGDLSYKSNLLYLHAVRSLLSPNDYLALAVDWERDLEIPPVRHFRAPGGRLRIGYVSGDFCQHAAVYFIEQILRYHDRERMEVFAYSARFLQDAATKRLEGLVDHWLPIHGLTDEQAAERIVSDGIDVLIDLSGHTAGNRLGIFARRAAPVQAHYLGYFASTGLSQMDYWIGDEVITPTEHDGYFRERVWRLPRTWVSYEGKAEAPETQWGPAEDGTVWLGSFNALVKLTPATIALWGRVLRALPEGRLLLKTKGLADEANRRRLLSSFEAEGVSADRIELVDAGATPSWPEHMAYYDRIDIALDPVGGQSGGTTTCDALWMGVPVVTLRGDRMASRMTASMLSALGHNEWIAGSEEAYIETAVSLARDVALRRSLRPGQRSRMAASALCDAEGLARALEKIYTGMMQRVELT